MRGPLVIAALVAIAAAAPLMVSEFWIYIVIEALAFALYAASFNLLLGYGGMLSFGHAAYFGLGGYAVAILMAKAGLSMWLALGLAPFLSAAAAVLVGWFAVRLSGIYFAMLTFAFQMLFYTVALKFTTLTGGDDGIVGFGRAELVAEPWALHLFVLAVVVAALLALWRLTLSPFGQVLAAARENPRRVQYFGVNVRFHRWAAFVVAGAFAGLAGGLFALSTGSVFPGWLDWTASAIPVVMAVLGGLRVFMGAVVGAFVYVGLETVISGYTEFWPLVMGATIVALVLLLPEGILGTRLRRERA